MSLITRIIKPKQTAETLEERIAALSGHTDSELFAIATNSTEVKLQEAAVRRMAYGKPLLDLALGDYPAKVSQAARQHIGELLEENPELVDTLTNENINQAELINLTVHSPSVNEKLFAGIDDETVLVDIAINGKTTQVRQKAAEKIEAREHLETVLGTAKERDKSVVKIIKAKLEVFKAADAEFAKNRALAAELCERAEQLVNREADEQFKHRLERIEASWNKLGEAERRESDNRYQIVIATCRQKLQARLAAEAERQEQAREAEQARQAMSALSTQLNGLARKLYEAESVDAELESHVESRLQEANAEAGDIKQQGFTLDAEYKNYLQTAEAVNELWQQMKTDGPLAKLVSELKSGDSEKGGAIKTKINNLLRYKSLVRGDLPGIVTEAGAAIADWVQAHREKAEKDKKRLKKINELIAKANRAIAAGHVRQARGITRELNEKREKHGDLPANVTARLEELDQAMAKLNDWHEFAVLPKKQAVVEQMEALVEANIHPDELAERIKSLQQEWKVLCKGGENQDQDLWQRLQTAADKAFEPCRQYFDKKAEEREQNLAKREELISQVSHYLNAYDWDNAVWKDVEQTMRVARETWQHYWPVPKKKMNSMQTRFDAMLEQIHGKVKAARESIGDAKQKLVDRVEQLAQQADVAGAINEVKNLQAQWKTLDARVSMGRKQDQKLWKAFRGHCDAIFQKRDAEYVQVNAERAEESGKAKALLERLDNILGKNGEEFYQAKKSLQAIKDEFHALGELPKGEHGKIKNSFNKKLELIEDKGRQQRNAAIKQTWDILFEVANEIREYELAVINASEPDSERSETLATIKEHMEAVQNWPAGGKDILQARLKAASSLKAADVADSENTLRLLCIRVEIAKGQESPPEDKTLRMEYQVQQLQQSFGRKNIADTQEALALEWVAIPGVADPVYSDLLKRFNSNR